MIKLAVACWVICPFWVWFILTRSDDDLEIIGVLVCVGLLILALLGL